MLSNRKSFSSMYRLQKTLLTVFYIVSAIVIFCVIGYILIHIFHTGFFVIAASAIIYLILATLFGSFMTIISYIPSNLAGAFDPIKNDIANRRIKTSRDFSERLVFFSNDFFNFAFMDVEHSIVKIRQEEPSKSFASVDLNWEELSSMAEKSHEVSYLGKRKIESENLHCYLIPIWFGEEWLGYYGVFTKSKLWKIFVDLLADFENSYIDDQLIHVLDYQDSASK